MSPVQPRGVTKETANEPSIPSHVGDATVRSSGIATTLWIIALAAFFTSALYFWHFQNYYYPDTPSYIAPAQNLLAGRGFTGAAFTVGGVSVDSNGAPEVFRTPGYPLFLALFLWIHAGVKWAVLFQHALRILMIVGTAAFAFRLTGSQRVALLTGVLLTIDFPLLESTHAILTELLFTIVMVIVYWLLWRAAKSAEAPWFSLLLAGLLAGASVLIRPVSILFFVPGAVFLMLARPRLKTQAALVFVAGFACLPAAWAMRNYRAIGHFTVSTVFAYNALMYRAAGALAIERPGNFYENFAVVQKELDTQTCSDFLRLYARDCSQMSLAEKSGYYTLLARQIVLQHRSSYVKVTARGAAVMMLDGGATTLTGIAGTSWPVGMRVLVIYTAPVFLLALYGLWKYRKTNRSFFWLAVLVIGYFVAISAGPESYARFRVPILPIYAILAATGLDALLFRLKITRMKDRGETAKADLPFLNTN